MRNQLGVVGMGMGIGLLVLPLTLAGAETTQIENQLDAYLRPYAESNNFSGAVLLARENKILFRKAYGYANYELKQPNTPDTVFHIASISKPFTAAVASKLVEAGKISLVDPVAKYVPDFPHGTQITIQNLLTHTSGIPNINDLREYETASRFRQTPASLIELFKSKPLDFEPGSQYRYSNSNYNLLAYIIEKVAGKSYAESLEEQVLRPAGLRHTLHDGDARRLIPGRAAGYQPAGASGMENAPYIDWSSKTGNGSLCSTVDDLYRFDRAMQQGKILAPETLKQIWQERKGNNFGWFVRKRDGRLAIGTNGRSPGFVASLERYVSEDLVVILLSNSYSAVSQSPIAADLARIALGEKPQSSYPAHVSPPPAAKMQSYAGAYRFGPDYYRPNAELTVRAQENAVLLLDWGGDFAATLLPMGPNEFVDRMFWARIRFDESTGELIYNDGQEFRAKRLTAAGK